MGKNQHVVPHGDGWAVRGEGNERATSVHVTQSEATRCRPADRHEPAVGGADPREERTDPGEELLRKRSVSARRMTKGKTVILPCQTRRLAAWLLV